MFDRLIPEALMLIFMGWLFLDTRRTERRMMAEVENLMDARSAALDALAELALREVVGR